MAVLGRIGGGPGPDRNIAIKASAASRLLRAYTGQVEALRRLRNGGSQYVRVEHVHVNEGGQAVIGNVKAPGYASAWKPPERLHAQFRFLPFVPRAQAAS